MPELQSFLNGNDFKAGDLFERFGVNTASLPGANE